MLVNYDKELRELNLHALFLPMGENGRHFHISRTSDCLSFPVVCYLKSSLLCIRNGKYRK